MTDATQATPTEPWEHRPIRGISPASAGPLADPWEQTR